MNPQAEELNQILQATNPSVLELLSDKGKAIYFPSRGILAQGAAARGREINATIGTAYEDDGMPMVLPSIADFLKIDRREAFPYAPSEGLAPLRKKWQELILAKNPSLGKSEFSLPVVTCGVTHGLSIAGYLFTDTADRIILSDLYWENYDLVFTAAYGARLKTFNLFRRKGFDIASFKEAVNSGPVGKKVVLLNFPNNPSGYTPTIKEEAEITEVLKEAADAGNRLAVILDDSYFDLVFEAGVMTESLFSQLANCHENLLAVKMDGITKEEYAWGLRVGFITYGIKNGSRALFKALEDKTAGTVRGSISNSPHHSQSIFLQALSSKTHCREKQANKEKIRQRYLKVKAVLKARPDYGDYFEALPFNSGYFMCVRLKKSDPERVWRLLLNKFNTGVICLAEKSLFRIAFASTPLDKIEKLFDNIYLACKECD